MKTKLLIIFASVGLLFLIPYAFASESFYGTSSFENTPSELIPGIPAQFEIKFQYTAGPYALSNFSPVMDVSPTSASSMVYLDLEPIEGISQGQIARIPVKIIVNPNIEHEKIFLSVYFTGDHFSSRSDAFYKSAWTDSITLDIAPKDLTSAELPSSEDYEFETMSGARCDGKISLCYGTFHNGTTMPIQCDYRHSCGLIPFDNSDVFSQSPLKQFKTGTLFSEIKCNGNLHLTQRYDGTPACVKDETVFELIKRGWTSDIIRLVQSRDVFLDPKDATSSYMDRITPTVEDFKNTLSEPYDIDEIFSKFGEPHDDIGSGIHIYVYELNDSTEIWIGYVDDIWYVKHVDADIKVLEELFVKNQENPKDCPISFNSRCTTGTVTEIFDGNNIRVEHALFRLALISHPELDEEEGGEAKEFLESICPVGSDALVDQDDLRPLEHLTGTGRIIAVVYCNGLNLNEELVEHDFEYFDGTYCYTSEFADDPWAEEGCSE